MKPELIFCPPRGEPNTFNRQLSPYKVTKEMSDAIDKIADDYGIKKTDIVRYALQRAIEAEEWEELVSMKKEFRKKFK